MSKADDEYMNAWFNELNEDTEIVSQELLGIEMSASCTAIGAIIHKLATQIKNKQAT